MLATMASIGVRELRERPRLRASAPPVISLGTVELVTLAVDRPHTIEQLGTLAYQRADKFVILIVEAGAVSVAQRGRQCRLQEGQYALFDCGHAAIFSGLSDHSVMAIFIPAILLQARLRNVPTIAAQPLACTGSPWRIAANLVKLLASEIRHISAPTAFGYANQLVEMVSIAVESGTELAVERSGRNAIFRRCTAYLRGHLADSSLDPQKIADATGISVRYLHKVFQEAGETVCEYLRTTRLDTARQELADPLKAAIQIREIAHRVGFRSQAHFAASFKQRYGISASEWRKSARNQPVASLVPSNGGEPGMGGHA
ncbi:AraC family transcriptional regulator [Mesorhizobium sp. L-8-10]|uniref:AraC family transcriptional regulator n=1 Tax=Mesorhizobium sp. L-8-10 TaxID=2744523 RepID=UPI0019296B93|nr:AraC family transcriptional regulator [Mesorhizobium sp. L-8-10]BCH29341.1 AraC family transcriptional regulator [Mesorhizobium sp. L-8-10]